MRTRRPLSYVQFKSTLVLNWCHTIQKQNCCRKKQRNDYIRCLFLRMEREREGDERKKQNETIENKKQPNWFSVKPANKHNKWL